MFTSRTATVTSILLFLFCGQLMVTIGSAVGTKELNGKSIIKERTDISANFDGPFVGKYYHGDQCPIIAPVPYISLEECLDKCLSHRGPPACTAVNYVASHNYCELLACTLPVPPPATDFVVYNAYSLKPACTVSGISRKSFTTKSLLVNWIPPTSVECNIDRYGVRWAEISSPTHFWLVNISKPPYNITKYNTTSLTPCTKYMVSVAIIKGDPRRYGEWNVPVALETGSQAAGKVSGISRKSFTAHTLELTWIPPPDNGCAVDWYKVRWINSKNYSDAWLTVRSSPAINITSLKPDTGYIITIYANNIAGYGEPSDPITLYTGVEAPKKCGESKKCSKVNGDCIDKKKWKDCDGKLKKKWCDGKKCGCCYQ